jgi:hypothetical protein
MTTQYRTLSAIPPLLKSGRSFMTPVRQLCAVTAAIPIPTGAKEPTVTHLLNSAVLAAGMPRKADSALSREADAAKARGFTPRAEECRRPSCRWRQARPT